MNRNLFRTITMACVVAVFTACTDSPTTTPTPQIGPSVVPAYDATTPFNNAGACMADDAVRTPTGTIPSLKFGDDPLTATNCTSQDVKIAVATVTNYLLADSLGNFSGTPIPFDSTTNVTCTEGQGIQLTMSAKLDQTANSTRADVGIWLATDGGRAITGACNHYNLPVNPLGTGITNPDGDSCGDLQAGAKVPNFPLGTFVAKCETNPDSTNAKLHIGSCLGWTEPGADRVCPLPDADPTKVPNWTTVSPDGFRFGTLYGNKAKCNCDGFDVPITVVRPPNLTIAKTADSVSVSAGSQIGFTVTLGNTGQGPAQNVAVSDPLPSGTGVSWSIATPVTGWSITGSAPNQTLVFSAVSFAKNATSSVHVVSSTTSASCKAYVNTATASLTNGTAPDPVTATTTVGCPTIGITKTPASQTKNAGESFSWTVTLTNNGPGVATGANINDPLPTLTGVTYSVGAGSDATCAINAATSTLTCGPKDLAVNGTIVAIVTATTTAGSSCSASGITNTATGKATGVSDVQASAVTILNCPSIGITKTPASQTKNAGESFSWTVTLTNSGDGTAVGANISDPLPVVTGVTYSLGAGSDATCAINAATSTLTCGPKDLAKNGTIVAIITATTTAGTSCAANGFTNTATGKATGVSDVQASATVTLNCPNIGITKTPASQTKNAGESFSWTVTLTNSGDGTAVGANINDPLPTLTGVTYALGAGSDATCAINAATSTLTCGPKDLAKNATIVAIVTATTTAGTSCGLLTNTATGKATGVSDVQASASTTLNCPSIGITKTPASQTKNAGESFSWTVTLTNNGTGTAVGANISDPLPSATGVTYALGAGSDATCAINSNTLTCGPKDLAASGTIVAIVTATTTAGQGCGVLNNTATGKATGVSDVQASASTTLNCPSIGITKTPASQTVASGSPFSWTVTLTNSGAGTAVGANISDPLPVVSGVTYSLGAGSDATCAINAATSTLTCGPKDLAPNGTIVAIIAATTTAGQGCSANGFTNTATGKATGVSDVQASATTILTCPQVGGLIAPTQTTCEQFALGIAPAEPGLFAGLKGNTINNVSPGVIFYFATVTIPAGGGTVNVLQSDTRADGKSPPFPLLQVAQGQAYIKTFNANTNQCSTVGTFNLSNPNAPTITVANAGTYIVQIKYSPNSLTGYVIPNPPVAGAFPVHYTWEASINGGGAVGQAAVDLNKK